MYENPNYPFHANGREVCMYEDPPDTPTFEIHYLHYAIDKDSEKFYFENYYKLESNIKISIEKLILLVDYGAKVNKLNSRSNTPLDVAQLQKLIMQL